MATAVATHFGCWTEDDLIGLPPDANKYELVEGALLVNPSPAGRHQLVSWELTRQLKQACPSTLVAVEALGVRLPEGTMLIPDVLVADRDAVLADRGGILDPAAVRLVVEIVSPGSRTMDRLTKPALYARGGIPSFWRVELDEGPAIVAYSLERGGYVEVGSARPGDLLVADRPFPVSVDPGSLRP